MSFNIARSRKVDEPDTAEWDYDGDCLPYDIDWTKCAEQGCSFAVFTERPRNKIVNYNHSDDPCYSPEEETMYEPYEYDSDYESDDIDEPQNDNGEENHEQDVDHQWYSDWCSTLSPTNQPKGEPVWITGPVEKEYVISPVTKDGEVLKTLY